VSSRELLSHVLGESVNRRSVLKKLGIAAAAAGVATVSGTRTLEAQSPLVMTDILQLH
jgi:hypothetical protein